MTAPICIAADLWSRSPPYRDKLPCGVRDWLIAIDGREYVTLLSPASLESARLERECFDQLKARVVDYDISHMRERLIQNMQAAEKYHRRFSRALAERVIASLGPT